MKKWGFSDLFSIVMGFYVGQKVAENYIPYEKSHAKHLLLFFLSSLAFQMTFDVFYKLLIARKNEETQK